MTGKSRASLPTNASHCGKFRELLLAHPLPASVPIKESVWFRNPLKFWEMKVHFMEVGEMDERGFKVECCCCFLCFVGWSVWHQHNWDTGSWGRSNGRFPVLRRHHVLATDPQRHKITDHYRYEEQVTWVNNATCPHPAKGPNCVICLHVIIREWVESARRARGLLCVESY